MPRLRPRGGSTTRSTLFDGVNLQALLFAVKQFIESLKQFREFLMVLLLGNAFAQGGHPLAFIGSHGAPPRTCGLYSKTLEYPSLLCPG